MDSIFAALGNAPTTVVYGIVGAVLGALGGVVGWFLEKKVGWRFGRFLPMVAIVCTVPVAKQVIIPRAINASMNKNLPFQVDPYTVLVSASLQNRQYTYHYTLSDEIPEDADLGVIKQEGLKGMCAAFAPSFQRGDLVRVNYEYQLHGKSTGFSLTPSDCPKGG